MKGKNWFGWVVVFAICGGLNLAQYLGYIQLPFGIWLI